VVTVGRSWIDNWGVQLSQLKSADFEVIGGKLPAQLGTIKNDAFFWLIASGPNTVGVDIIRSVPPPPRPPKTTRVGVMQNDLTGPRRNVQGSQGFASPRPRAFFDRSKSFTVFSKTLQAGSDFNRRDEMTFFLFRQLTLYGRTVPDGDVLTQNLSHPWNQ